MYLVAWNCTKPTCSAAANPPTVSLTLFPPRRIGRGNRTLQDGTAVLPLDEWGNLDPADETSPTHDSFPCPSTLLAKPDRDLLLHPPMQEPHPNGFTNLADVEAHIHAPAESTSRRLMRHAGAEPCTEVPHRCIPPARFLPNHTESVTSRHIPCE